MANEKQILWENKCHLYFKQKVKSSHHNCLSVLALHIIVMSITLYVLAFKM